MPVKAPFFQGAKLLIAADCTAYAYANFHQEFMRGKVTIVGCPKLDPVDYSEKLTEILRENDIKSVTIVRMEVPCCGGLEMAAKNGDTDVIQDEHDRLIKMYGELIDEINSVIS